MQRKMLRIILRLDTVEVSMEERLLILCSIESEKRLNFVLDCKGLSFIIHSVVEQDLDLQVICLKGFMRTTTN